MKSNVPWDAILPAEVREPSPKIKTEHPDPKIMIGNPNRFQILFSEADPTKGWYTSTMAMPVAGGALVRVTTKQRNPDGSYALAESVCFVPCVRIHGDVNGGNKLSHK